VLANESATNQTRERITLRVIRTFGLLLVVAAALAAVSAASASAAPVFESKGGSGKEKVNTKDVTAFVLKGTVQKTTTEIKCETVSSTNATFTIGTSNDNAEHIEFSKCKVVKPAACTVSEPIKTVEVNTTLEEEKGIVFDKFVPAAGTKFTEITIGSCAIKGTYEVTGTARAEIPHATEFKKSHELVFNSGTGSALEFDKAAATLTGTAADEAVSFEYKAS